MTESIDNRVLQAPSQVYNISGMARLNGLSWSKNVLTEI